MINIIQKHPECKEKQRIKEKQYAIKGMTDIEYQYRCFKNKKIFKTEINQLLEQ